MKEFSLNKIHLVKVSKNEKTYALKSVSKFSDQESVVKSHADLMKLEKEIGLLACRSRFLVHLMTAFQTKVKFNFYMYIYIFSKLKH